MEIKLKAGRVTVIAALLTMIILVVLGTGNKRDGKRSEAAPMPKRSSNSPFSNFTSGQQENVHARGTERLAALREERQKAAYDAYKNAGGQA